MTTRNQRSFLKAQLVDIQRLRKMAGNHPIMSVSLTQRENYLRDKINALPVGHKEARAVLFFSGEPVQGSVGIDANFASRVLEPFQSMVMADYAERWHGVVRRRGPRLGQAQSRLLLTSLPRGSFGLELTRAESDEIFEEDQLADVLVHITKLIESASESDDAFAQELDGTAARVIQNLRNFLEIIAIGRAGLRLETGDFQCSMNSVKANEAFNRVSGTITKEEIIELQGVLRGLLMEAWRFDFIDKDDVYISGKIDDGVEDDTVARMEKEFFNENCIATFLKATVHFTNGRIRTTYILKEIKSL